MTSVLSSHMMLEREKVPRPDHSCSHEVQQELERVKGSFQIVTEE